MERKQFEINTYFISYLKNIRETAGISTRQLSTLVGKSTSYVSFIESGRIKKIDYNTAFNLLKTINDIKPFVESGKKSTEDLLSTLLVETFGILPDELWEEFLKSEEKELLEKEEKYKKFIDKKNKLSALIPLENENLVDTLIGLAEAELDHKQLDYISWCCYVMKKQPKYQPILFMVHNVIHNDSEGWGMVHSAVSKKDAAMYKAFKEILIKNKYIKEE